MQPSDGKVHEISIDRIRQDAALITRGYLVLQFYPGFAALMLLVPMIRELPSVDLERIASPLLWFLLALSAVFAVASRSCSTRFTSRCLWFLIGSQLSLLLGAAAWTLVTMSEPLTLRRLQEMPAEAIAGLSLAALPSVFLIWWLFIVPMRAALRLLRTRIEPGDALLIQVMAAQPRSGRAHPVAVRTTSTVSGASTMYLAAAWALGIVSTAAVLWLISTEHALVGLGLQFAALYAVRMLWRRSRRHAALNSQALQSLDPRAPVLYLRSFGDDPGLMQAEWDAFIKTRAGSIAAAAKRGPGRLARAWRKYSIGWLSTTGRLEEGIAPELANVGPFVGIGAPNERLPELGAARAYFTSETWQDAIVKWVDLARLIIKVAGPTRWIRWELDTIIDRGAPMKLIILMPPVDPGGRLMRWQNLMAELQSTLWAPALGSIDATRLVALRFLEDGKVSIVTGGKGRLLDYLLALRLMLFQLRSPSDVVSRPSAC